MCINQRVRGLSPRSPPLHLTLFEFWPTLDIREEDHQIIKRRYSAFIKGSSNIELILTDNGIENILICGVATNVCCESTARDAMMLNDRTLMVAGGGATFSDEGAYKRTNFFLHQLR